MAAFWPNVIGVAVAIMLESVSVTVGAGSCVSLGTENVIPRAGILQGAVIQHTGFIADSGYECRLIPTLR
jgi:hypothetical protein